MILTGKEETREEDNNNFEVQVSLLPAAASAKPSRFEIRQLFEQGIKLYRIWRARKSLSNSLYSHVQAT